MQPLGGLRRGTPATREIHGCVPEVLAYSRSDGPPPPSGGWHWPGGRGKKSVYTKTNAQNAQTHSNTQNTEHNTTHNTQHTHTHTNSAARTRAGARAHTHTNTNAHKHTPKHAQPHTWTYTQTQKKTQTHQITHTTTYTTHTTHTTHTHTNSSLQLSTGGLDEATKGVDCLVFEQTSGEH